MGQTLEVLIPHSTATKNLVGWMAHMINLVAKSGTKTFDTKKVPQVKM